MLGYRGHFATKSRRYSTTMRALRAARRNWKRRRHPLPERQRERTVITLTDLQWAGRSHAKSPATPRAQPGRHGCYCCTYCCTKIKERPSARRERPLNWWAILGSNQ